jgi:hypothetical protein
MYKNTWNTNQDGQTNLSLYSQILSNSLTKY